MWKNFRVNSRLTINTGRQLQTLDLDYISPVRIRLTSDGDVVLCRLEIRKVSTMGILRAESEDPSIQWILHYENRGTTDLLTKEEALKKLKMYGDAVKIEKVKGWRKGKIIMRAEVLDQGVKVKS